MVFIYKFVLYRYIILIKKIRIAFLYITSKFEFILINEDEISIFNKKWLFEKNY